MFPLSLLPLPLANSPQPNPGLSPSGLDQSLVCGQLQSLGIIQTCEVLKAGLPTRVPHTQLLGASGVGGAPSAVAKLMAGQPLVVRVALVLKLYGVPSDAYRVGKTRIFFKVRHPKTGSRLCTLSTGAQLLACRALRAWCI